MKKGDFIKVVGGDHGVRWNGRAWERFECVGCMYAQRLIVPTNRLQGKYLPMDFSKMPVIYRHDVAIHRDWIRRGKPTGEKNETEE